MFDVIARNKSVRLLVVIMAAAFSRFAVMAWLGDRQVSDDIGYFQLVADTLRAGRSVYDLDWQVYTYPPSWMYAAGLLRSIGEAVGVSFTLLIKQPQVFADCVVCALLVSSVGKRTGQAFAPLLAGLAYALNPLSIMSRLASANLIHW